MRLFFDLYDDTHVFIDQHGDHFAGEIDVGVQATAILADMLRESLPSRSGHSYRCRVRNDDGTVVYEASLTFSDGGRPTSEAA